MRDVFYDDDLRPIQWTVAERRRWALEEITAAKRAAQAPATDTQLRDLWQREVAACR